MQTRPSYIKPLGENDVGEGEFLKALLTNMTVELNKNNNSFF